MRPFFDELKSYVGFGPRDERALERFHPFARPHLAAIADEFYAVVRLHEGAAAVLRDEAQVRRLKATLEQWMNELLSGPWDDAYLERRARIGQVHVRVGLRQHYMVTAMSRVRSALVRLVTTVAPGEPEHEAELRRAIGRVCDLDLAIMLETYREDVISRLRRIEQVERDVLATRVADLERLYREATETAELLMLTLDGGFRVLLVNANAARTTGHAPDELIGRDPFPILFGDDAESVRAAIETAAASATAVELPLLTRSGHRRLVRWRAARHDHPELGGTMWIVTGTDVTDERNLARTARINERLAVAGTLAAGLAHEIRNPLNGASLHVSVLERALGRLDGVPPSAFEAAAVLKTELKRLSSLVSDFLEVARPRPLTRTPVDLNDVVASIATLVAPESESRGVEVRVERFPFPVELSLDRDTFRQALLNLVQNATDAASEQGGHVVLRVRQSSSDAYVDVEDDGPGMRDPNAPIFDAFFTTKERGTGLGLSIVHRIVSDHGGDVTFDTRPGRTVFTVRLPLDLR